MNYLDELNPSQRIAVEQIDGPMMVIAGAGSGKTRVLTYRIAHMLEQGVDASHILALTFTNKAAKEMKDRIIQVLSSDSMSGHTISEAKTLTMGTFHSVFSKLLRKNADRLGFSRDFTIYDTQDSKSLIKSIVTELKLDPKLYKPNLILNDISATKNNLQSYKEYILQEQQRKESGDYVIRPETGRIFKYYAVRCFRANAMDFDDLLYYTYILLHDNPDILGYYQQKFRYILVDEYQDTNHAQYIIVKMLASVYENICVVGDDAQSIYSFRGANIQNIFTFRTDYPDFKLYKLEQNYRSTKNIVQAANSVIERNKEQIKKELWTDNQEGSLVHIVRTTTDLEEGKLVVNRLFDISKNQGCLFSDFAILYRTNSQTRVFEEALRKLNIPYKIFGGLSFYQRKEIKDVLAYFRLAINPHDEEAIKRVINYPARGIGLSTINKIIVHADLQDLSIWTIIENIHAYQVPITEQKRKDIENFAFLIKSFASQLERKNAYELGKQIVQESGILKLLFNEKHNGTEEIERYQNVEELINALQTFAQNQTNEDTSLAAFMSEVALLTTADLNDEQGSQYVSLMTIHSSKGLEFPHVFLVGLEEGLFPTSQTFHSQKDLEEERRLFYVALTRAMNSCTISFAGARYRNGSMSACDSSRFIDEINPNYIHYEIPKQGNGRSLNEYNYLKLKGFKSTNTTETSNKNARLTPLNQAKGGKDNTPTLKVGYNVRHPNFGHGKITKIEGEGGDKKAVIFFPNIGTKTMLLRFAKLQIIDSEQP